MAKIIPAGKLAVKGGARKGASAGGAAIKRSRKGDPRPPLSAIRCEETLAAGVSLLRSLDPEAIERMLAEAGPPPLRSRSADLAGLAWIVISQQVSTASANAINARFVAAFPGVVASEVCAASDTQLRACGLSAPKIRALRSVAAAAYDGRLDFEALARMDVAEARASLVSLHGIGPWTADIFLLFCLGHPDVWPAGDLALQEAARMVLGLKARPDAKGLEKIGERWRPARGVAARLLWAWYGATRRKAVV